MSAAGPPFTFSLRVLLLAAPAQAQAHARFALAGMHAYAAQPAVAGEPAAFADVSARFLQFSADALQHGSHRLRLYALLCWLVLSRECRACVRASGAPELLAAFYRVLQRALVFAIHGVKPSGAVYSPDEKHAFTMRQLDFFVLHAATIFALL